MTDNGIMEKYCCHNEPDSCIKYGGFYHWDEMMQYTTHPGARGICPTGWHIPTDEEWKVLEGSVDSQYGIGDQRWDEWGYERGYDAGTNLKTTYGWYLEGNGTDLSGFSGLPGGSFSWGSFNGIGTYGMWLSSSEVSEYGMWYRMIKYDSPGSRRETYTKGNGFSVRCLRDY